MTKLKSTGTTEQAQPKAPRESSSVALIYIRGLGREQLHWGKFPRLARKLCLPGCQEFYIDLPGNGELADRQSPASLKGYSDFLESQINSLPLGHFSDVRLVSISMGAMVVLRWLEGRDDSVISRFYLLNTSCGQFSPFYRRLIPKALTYLLRYLGTADVTAKERNILRLVANSEEAREANLEAWVTAHQRRTTQPSNLVRQLLASASFQRLGPIPLAHRITMVAAKADRMVHYSCGQHIARHLGCPLILHDHAGHDLPLDDPQWLAELVTLGLSSSSAKADDEHQPAKPTEPSGSAPHNPATA